MSKLSPEQTEALAKLIADGLSPKAAIALLGPWPRAARFLHSTHRRWFERNCIANEGYSRSLECWAYHLSPFGKDVRAALSARTSLADLRDDEGRAR
jgi:hypothetical protein